MLKGEEFWIKKEERVRGSYEKREPFIRTGVLGICGPEFVSR